MSTSVWKRLRIALSIAAKSGPGAAAAYVMHLNPIAGSVASAAATVLTAEIERHLARASSGGKNRREEELLFLLEGVGSKSALTRILRDAPLNTETTHDVATGIRMLALSDDPARERFRNWLCQICLDMEQEPRAARFAAAVLTGTAREGDGLGEFRASIRRHVETGLQRMSFKHIGTIESLAFLFGLEGDGALYAKFMMAGIGNPQWRVLDAKLDIAFCGSRKNAIRTRFNHLMQRSSAGLTSAHDASRSIYLLQTTPNLRDDIYGEKLRKLTLASLSWDDRLRKLAEAELGRKHI